MLYNTKKLKEVIGRVSKAVEDDADIDSFREMKFCFYDGTTAISAYMPGLSIEEAFGTQGKAMPTVGLTGKKLKAIIDHLSDEECDITNDGSKTVIRSGRSRYTLPVAADRDFMDFSWPQCLELLPYSKNNLLKPIKRCIMAAEKENQDRPERSVIHINGRHIVSSDGVVMACQGCSDLAVPEPFNLSMSHAGRLVRILSSLEGDTISYAFDRGALYLMHGRLAIVLTGVATSFPSYEVVLSGHKPVVSFPVNRRGFLEAVSRLAALSDKHEQSMTLTVGHRGLTLHGIYGGSEVETFVEGAIALPEEEITIGFMVNHLLRGLKTLSEEEVTMGVVSPSRPVNFREGDYECFVVPRRF